MKSKLPLILDTNIISHAMSPNQADSYIKLFKQYEAAYIF